MSVEGIERHTFRTVLAEQTRIGREKVSQHSFQFEQVSRAVRRYLGLALNEIERQEALCSLSRRELAVLRGETSLRGRSRVRRQLRGRNGRNVAAKLAAQGNRCPACGHWIDPPLPMNAVLMHTVSLANGGPDELANTFAAHWVCNATMGTRDDYAWLRRTLAAQGWPIDTEAALLAASGAKRVR